MNTLTTVRPASLLMDMEAFNHMQRVAKILAMSPLFPDHLRKGPQETAIANGVLVMNMATRLNEDPLTVAQNIYFVGGKPGWSASYMISKANQHGVFKNPIDWDIKGKGDELAVTAFGELATTGKRVQVTCDMKMAKAEGWTKNAKYQSMPEQMLRYRSATFLIRLYCPEVMVGVPAAIENELAMKDVTPDYEPSGTLYEAQSEVEEKPEPKSAPKPAAEKSAPVEQEPAPEKAKAPQEERPSRNRKEEASSDGQLPLGDDEPEVDVDRWSSLADMIIEELEQSSVDEVEEMYGPQIEVMRNTKGLEALAKRVQAMIDAKK